MSEEHPMPPAHPWLHFSPETTQLQVLHRWQGYQLVAQAANIEQEHEKFGPRELVHVVVTVGAEEVDSLCLTTEVAVLGSYVGDVHRHLLQ